MPTAQPRPRWTGIPVRVVLLTGLFTLLAFALSLLLSIVGTVVYSWIAHIPADLKYGYRHIAFPFAITAGAVAFALFLVMEIRHYQVRRTIARMERARG